MGSTQAIPCPCRDLPGLEGERSRRGHTWVPNGSPWSYLRSRSIRLCPQGTRLGSWLSSKGQGCIQALESTVFAQVAGSEALGGLRGARIAARCEFGCFSKVTKSLSTRCHLCAADHK